MKASRLTTIVIALTMGSGLAFAAPAGPYEFERLYGQVLEQYQRPPAVIHGIRTVVFDFKTMAADAKADGSLFERTLRAFEQTDPGQFKTPDEEKAFWINAYNFGALKLVVENYPITSIRDRKVSTLKYPWSKKIVTVKGQRLSLKGIEQEKLLRRFQDPRIVFAVNCATISCPDLPSTPFTADGLDQQLDQLLRTFLANPTKGLRFDRQTGAMAFSWIFETHEDLIQQHWGGLAGVVHRYLDDETCAWFDQHQAHTTVTYIEHDWMLNDTALTRSDQQ